MRIFKKLDYFNAIRTKLLNHIVKFSLLYLIFLIIIGFSIRIYSSTELSMWIDETISAAIAATILEKGTPTLDSGFTYTRGILFHYVMAGLIFLFNEDLGAKMISLILGILTIFLAYKFSIILNFTSNINKDNQIIFGLIFATLITFSTIQVFYSQQARFFQGFQFFYFLNFYLMYLFLIKKNYIVNIYISYILLLSSILITIDLHVLGILSIPLLILSYCILKINEIKNILLVISNSEYYNLKNKMSVILAVIPIFILTLLFLSLFFNTIISHFSFEFVINFATLYYQHITFYSILFLVILGILIALYTSPQIHISFISYSIIPLISLFFIDTYASRYSFFIFFTLFFYSALLIYYLKIRIIVLTSIIILFSIFPHSVFTFTGMSTVNHDFSMPLADYRGAYEFLYSNNIIHQSTILISTWAPADIWYGNRDLNYWIEYSVDGRSANNWKFNGVEKFTGVETISNANELPKSFVLIIDEQSISKISNEIIELIEDNCEELFFSYNIEVLNCLIK